MSRFPSLSPEEKQALASLLVIRRYPKGRSLVSAGEVSTDCYFVLQGCLRQYRIVEGVEKTRQFYTENQAAVLLTS